MNRSWSLQQLWTFTRIVPQTFKRIAVTSNWQTWLQTFIQKVTSTVALTVLPHCTIALFVPCDPHPLMSSTLPTNLLSMPASPPLSPGTLQPTQGASQSVYDGNLFLLQKRKRYWKSQTVSAQLFHITKFILKRYDAHRMMRHYKHIHTSHELQMSNAYKFWYMVKSGNFQLYMATITFACNYSAKYQIYWTQARLIKPWWPKLLKFLKTPPMLVNRSVSPILCIHSVTVEWYTRFPAMYNKLDGLKQCSRNYLFYSILHYWCV